MLPPSTSCLNILSDEKVGRTLRMMGRNSNEQLTPQLGREVCERNGLKAAVSGSIAQLGNNYILQLDATNCGSGESVARTGAEVSGKDAILPTLGKAAIELRGKLGESLSSIHKFDKPFEGTSSSLEALKSYALAMKARREGSLTNEFALLQRAIASPALKRGLRPVPSDSALGLRRGSVVTGSPLL